MKSTLNKTTLLVAAFMGWTSAALAAALTVTPTNSITNDYVGKITFTITGLTAGQTVLVEKYVDFNANGAIDTGEPALQAGLVTDGSLPTIGGVRNLNVPGDEDGAANGQILMELPYPGAEKGLDVFAGKYLIKVSDPATHSALATSSFEVKQKEFPQGVSGRLTAFGTSTPLANAMVVMMPPDSSPVTGTLTDANGNYTLYGLPGNYMVLPLAPGFVGDFTGGVTVSAGTFATWDLALSAATHTISGKLKDSSSAVGIPGVMIQAESASGKWVSAFSQSDGTYSVGVLAGSWTLEPASESLTQLGYLGWNTGTNVSTVSGNVANLDLPVEQATALIYGTVKNNQNNPVIGIGIWASDQPNRQYDTFGTTFPPNADYCVGVRPGNWGIWPDSGSLSTLGYTGQGTNVTVAAGQAMRVDFILGQVNAHFIGRVVDNTGAPVGNISIGASDHQSAWTSVNTDGNGNFNLGVSSGTWYLQLSDDAALQSQLVSPQLQFTLADNETRNNIVVIVQRATGQIDGTVKDNSGTPLVNLGVGCTFTLNGTNYTSYVKTGSGGDFRLQAFNGNWLVWLDREDLQSRGFISPENIPAIFTGGNLTFNFVVQPVAPMLSYVRTVTNFMVISWPTTASGFLLEQTSQLLSAPQTTTWTPVGFSYTTNPPDVRVVVPLAPGNSFFRLRKP